MWDIAGQDYARTMARTYYKKASGCLVMFDLTNRRTFEEAKCWKADVDRKVLLPNSEPIPCLLVANKVGSSDPIIEFVTCEYANSLVNIYINVIQFLWHPVFSYMQ